MAKTIKDNGQHKLIKCFCSNTTIPACGYLITGHSSFERIFWFVVILTSILCTMLLTKHILHDWSSDAVFISLDASSLSISKVDFPGVAVCNINKISKYRAVVFANELSRFVKIINQTEILNLIRVFGNFYDANVFEANKFDILQDILNDYDNLRQEKDVSARLLALTVPCNEMLLNCSWNSVVHNCSDLFQTRLTDSGFCCVFNYVRNVSKDYLFANLNNNEYPKTPRQFPGTGVAKGLSVAINNNISDYFYTDMATRGYLVKIFSPWDFPDLSSGSLRQIIVQENSEVFVKVEANTLKSQEQIRVLPMELMCDTAIVGENNDCYMIWLAHNLKQMAEDILQFAIHDGSDVEATAGQYKKYMKDAVNFIAGSHLCQKYLYGSIGLDEFCAEMIDEDLGSFLLNIPQLPYELLVKYGIPPEDDAETDNGDVYHNAGEVETQCVQEKEADPKEAEEK